MTRHGDREPLDPHAHEPTGAEPVEARPAYRLRIAFAIVGLVLGIAGVVVFGLRIADGADTVAVWGLVVSALLVVTAVLDIAVIVRRRRRTQ